MPRSRRTELVPFNPEPERILRGRRNYYEEIHRAEDLSTLDTVHKKFLAENLSYEEDDQISASPPTTITMPKLSSHSEPTTASIPKGFTLPTTENGAFEIRPAFINMVERNQFGGGTLEDPATHLSTFADYCSTLPPITGVTADQIKELLFPFSLRDSAREWIKELDRDAAEITDWNTLALAFLKKYFPPQKTNALRSQISNFRQAGTEDLNEAWRRFKKLCRSVPHHGIPTWLLCNTFYNGLFDDQRVLLDSAANGRFQNNIDDDKAWNLIEEMATHTAEYGNPRGNSRQSGGSSSSVAAQLEALHAKFDKLETSNSSVQPVHAMVQQSPGCERCGEQGHGAPDCSAPVEQTYAFQSYCQGNPYSNFYNERTREHPNFSYRSNNVLNPSPLPQNQPYVPPHRNTPPLQHFNNQNFSPNQSQNFNKPPNFQQPPSSSNPSPTASEARLESMMQSLITQFQKSDQAKDASIKMLETQVAQLAANQKTRQPGTLPSQPNNSHESANAIYVQNARNLNDPRSESTMQEI
ncbi:hypothetical protein RND81_09G071300 [Saponaria officinalis]|uniref:CCHC-type domain-containing protein n=1 Tax=Saponaria officinalis TaxID=3572 RepID=A0AAW1IHX1_SAPOF